MSDEGDLEISIQSYLSRHDERKNNPEEQEIFSEKMKELREAVSSKYI